MHPLTRRALLAHGELLAGHGGDAVTWISESLDSWETSTAYTKTPVPQVKAYVDAIRNNTITFGIAPAFLAFVWGIHAVVGNPTALDPPFLESAGWVVTFLWVVCSAARLARFNTHSMAQVARSERPEHSKFVGMPTPASAGIVAAIVHFNYGFPMTTPMWVPFWLVLLTATSALMVSTWRYYSFKGLDFRRRRGFVMVILLGTLFAIGMVSGLIESARRSVGDRTHRLDLGPHQHEHAPHVGMVDDGRVGRGRPDGSTLTTVLGVLQGLLVGVDGCLKHVRRAIVFLAATHIQRTTQGITQVEPGRRRLGRELCDDAISLDRLDVLAQVA